VTRSTFCPKGSPPAHCLFLQGEEEPGLEGEERGGYLPIPRRDERAGEWELTMHQQHRVLVISESYPIRTAAKEWCW